MSAAARDLFLDSVRAVAIIRVVTWHSYGWAPITWLVSAGPAMVWRPIGHSGGTASLHYDGSQDPLFALQVPRGVWGANTIPLELLHETLTSIVANHPFE